METLITILLIILTQIICYYINKSILKKTLKPNTEYNWSLVNTNLLMSFFIAPSVIYWILVFILNLPRFPEKPPRWL